MMRTPPFVQVLWKFGGPAYVQTIDGGVDMGGTAPITV